MADLHPQIFDAVQARFAAITKAAGCQTDIGLRILPRRDTDRAPINPAETPCLCLYDRHGTITTDAAPFGQWQHTLTITCIAWFRGRTSEAEAWRALSDILTAIGKDIRWGGLAQYTDPDIAYVVDMRQGGEVVSGLKLDFEIIYQTPQWQV